MTTLLDLSTSTGAQADLPRPELEDGWRLWPEAAVRGAGLPIEWLLGLAVGPNGTAGSDVAELVQHAELAAAITWQNPAIAETWLPTATRPDRRLSGYRRSVLGRYVQRYCAKNDSIGFFGPVGWATLSEASAAALTINGASGVRQVLVQFEHWAVAALASQWADESLLAAHVPVRTHPALHLDGSGPTGGTAHLPGRRPIELSTAEVALVRAATGDGVTVVPDGLVSRLVQRGVLLRGFRIPVCARPQDHLREAVSRIADPSIRANRLARLDRLDLALAAAAAVWNEPSGLLAALTELEAIYRAVGGPSPRRSGDSSGAGRTLVYPDCRRDSDLVVGRPAIDALAGPLSLLLRSARWLTAEVAEVIEDRLAGIYAYLGDRGPVSLADLHFAAAETLTGSDPLVDAVVEDFHARWEEVLTLGRVEGDELRIDVDEARPLVAGLFRAERPGWAAARNHSPDLLPARTPHGVRWVLGELHVAMNTLESRFFHDLHDAPERLAEQSREDFAHGRTVPCYPVEVGVDSRRYPPLASHVEDRYLYWSYAADHGPHPDARSKVWPATGLTVRRVDGRLVAGPSEGAPSSAGSSPAAGAWTLPVVEWFGEFLSALVVNRFQLRAAADEQPRVVLGGLVVARRSWRLWPADLPAGLRSQRGYRVEPLADLLRSRGVPQHCFVRTAGERKPFYIDLEAPITLANLARVWLAATERDLGSGGRAEDRAVEVTEMLPGPDELVLADAGGSYTCELRFVAVDPESSGDLTGALAEVGRR